MIKKGKATIPLSTKCGLVDMYMACRLKSMANVTLEFDMSVKFWCFRYILAITENLHALKH